MSIIKKEFTFDAFTDALKNEDKRELSEELIALYDDLGSEIRLKDKRAGVYILSIHYHDNQLSLIIERIKHRFASIRSNYKSYELNEELLKALKAVQLLLHREIDLIEASDPEQFA
jgi:hypothetical protein